MTGTEIQTDFDRFWQAYPRKVSKKKARQVWAKLKPNGVTVLKIMEALKWQVNQPQWLKDGGAYVPHPTTWLHEERWDDEPFHCAPARDRFSGLREFIDG